MWESSKIVKNELYSKFFVSLIKDLFWLINQLFI